MGGDNVSTPVPTSMTSAPSSMAPTSFKERNPFSPPSGTWDEIKVTFELNLAICLLLVALFELKRAKKSVYTPRLKWVIPERAPTAPAQGFFRWIRSVRRVEDADLRRMVGLDAYMALRFLAMSRTLFVVATIVGAAVLFPTYAKGNRNKSGFDQFTLGNCVPGSPKLWAPVAFAYFFTCLSMHFLLLESKRYREFRLEFLRRGDIDDFEGLQPRCSVWVERLPKQLRAEDTLKRWFGELFGDEKIHSAVAYLDLKHLEMKLQERDRALDRLERTALKISRGGGKSCFSKEPLEIEGYSSVGDAPEEIEPNAELEKAVIGVEKAQAEASRLQLAAKEAYGRAHEPPRQHEEQKTGVFVDVAGTGASVLHTGASTLLGVLGLTNWFRRVRRAYRSSSGNIMTMDSAVVTSSTGVVTFGSPGVAAEAAQLRLSARARGPVCELAPSAGDIVWINVATPSVEVEQRRAVADISLVFLAAAWAPLIALIQAVSNLREIARVLPFFRPFVENEEYAYIRSLVTGYLPVLLVLGLLALLPAVLTWLAVSYVRIKTRSATERFVLSRYFYFQLLQIFVTVASGSFSAVLKDFIKRPATILKLLGTSLPGLGAYFLQLLIVKTLFSVAFELARPLPLLATWARQRYTRSNLFVVTRRQKKRLRESEAFAYGTKLPEWLMVLVIGAIYSPIAPLVLPLCALFFFLAETVFRYQFLYVYVRHFENGGLTIWPALTFFFSLALVVAQLTLVGYLAILQGARQSTSLIPLPIATYYFYEYLVTTFEEPARCLDKESAVRSLLYDRYRAPPSPTAQQSPLHPSQEDEDEEEEAKTCSSKGLSSEYYAQPAITDRPVLLTDGVSGLFRRRRPNSPRGGSPSTGINLNAAAGGTGGGPSSDSDSPTSSLV